MPPLPQPQSDLAVIPADAHFAPESALSVVLAMSVMVGVLDGFGQGALVRRPRG
jgi:hypothetical protein